MGLVELKAFAVEPADPPRVPDGMRIYAVGDIHGRLDLLLALQREIDADAAAHPHRRHLEIYLGDYVDRGPGSAGVLDRLMARRESGRVICLSGNHEEMMREAFADIAVFPQWLRVGGYEAVESYLPDAAAHASEEDLWAAWRAAVPRRHLDFLDSLDIHHPCGDYLFVHAGLRPGVPLAAQTRRDRLWIRHEFLDHGGPFGHVVVHGHTPVKVPEVRANRIGIDTGAYASGHLTCLVLEGAERYIIAT